MSNMSKEVSKEVTVIDNKLSTEIKTKITSIQAKRCAKQLAKYLRNDNVNHSYLKEVFRYLRKELKIEEVEQVKKEPYVPSEEEIKKYYQIVWKSQNMQNMVIIKTLLYTGLRSGEIIKIKLEDVDLDGCKIDVKDKKDNGRIVLFPEIFKELLGMHIQHRKEKNKGAIYLFESSWQKPYSDRGIRKLLTKYSQEAGLERTISPHKIRYFLFKWMGEQGIESGVMGAYKGSRSKNASETYETLGVEKIKKEYDKIITNFPL